MCVCVSGGPGVPVAVHGQAAADGAHHQLSPSGAPHCRVRQEQRHAGQHPLVLYLAEHSE
jgi:hypothetical protein